MLNLKSNKNQANPSDIASAFGGLTHAFAMMPLAAIFRHRFILQAVAASLRRAIHILRRRRPDAL
jgi:hypothetical protein